MKLCNICKIEKDENFFYKLKNGKSYSYCKECSKASARKWAKDNPEKNKEKSKKWDKEHPGYVSSMMKKSRDKDPEKDRQRCRDWKKANPEKHRQWGIDHPEKVNASRKQYFHKRRLILKDTDITIDFLIHLKEDAKICPLCGKEMIDISVPFHPDQKQLDHILPISLGGRHYKDNVRIICGKCNDSRPRTLDKFQSK
jgi:5-methylcytosine-specific restriction endonuclease McrA